MLTSTYSLDQATTDIRDLQRVPTDGLIEADNHDAPVDCTNISCRYYPFTQCDFVAN